MSTETSRIEFLEKRDGVVAAKQWVHECIGLYEAALRDPEHFANSRYYRPKFEQSIREFKEYLGWPLW